MALAFNFPAWANGKYKPDEKPTQNSTIVHTQGLYNIKRRETRNRHCFQYAYTHTVGEDLNDKQKKEGKLWFPRFLHQQATQDNRLLNGLLGYGLRVNEGNKITTKT